LKEGTKAKGRRNQKGRWRMGGKINRDKKQMEMRERKENPAKIEKEAKRSKLIKGR
jgi:hypothetical protein